MSDKPIAILSAVLVVAPLCSVCILGPAVVGGFFAGWLGWLADLSPLQVIVIGVIGAALLLGIVRYRHSRKSETLVIGSEGRP